MSIYAYLYIYCYLGGYLSRPDEGRGTRDDNRRDAETQRRREREKDGGRLRDADTQRGNGREKTWGVPVRGGGHCGGVAAFSRDIMPCMGSVPFMGTALTPALTRHPSPYQGEGTSCGGERVPRPPSPHATRPLPPWPLCLCASCSVPFSHRSLRLCASEATPFATPMRADTSRADPRGDRRNAWPGGRRARVR